MKQPLLTLLLLLITVMASAQVKHSKNPTAKKQPKAKHQSGTVREDGNPFSEYARRYRERKDSLEKYGGDALPRQYEDTTAADTGELGYRMFGVEEPFPDSLQYEYGMRIYDPRIGRYIMPVDTGYTDGNPYGYASKKAATVKKKKPVIKAALKK